MRKSFALLLIILLADARLAFAMTSTNFQINWDSFNEAGNELGSSTNYSLHDTVGDLATGTSTSANYQLSAGYRTAEGVPTLSLLLRGQDNSSQVSYTAFNNGAKTVTVSSATGFAIGDYIAVVENQGFSEMVAVGRIADIVGLVITVDAFVGDNGSMSASPSGGDDFVYRFQGSSIALGTLTPTSQAATTALVSVQSTVASGYSVYVQADRLLTNGSYNITTVTDGTVSPGSEEYGASATGTAAVSPGIDIGVTTTQRVIQTTNVPSVSPADREAMIYKLSIIGSTPSGAYSQNVAYTLTANF